jgi:hypothetical protein
VCTVGHRMRPRAAARAGYSAILAMERQPYREISSRAERSRAKSASLLSLMKPSGRAGRGAEEGTAAENGPPIMPCEKSLPSSA